MNNTVIALDILNASLQVAARVNEMLTKAQMENRDITDNEILVLKAGNDSLEQQILKS